MGPLKKHLTPIGKGGITKHAGKGSQQTTLPARGAMDKLAKNPNATINDYSKADPQSQPAGDPGGMPPMLGTGGWDGGMP